MTDEPVMTLPDGDRIRRSTCEAQECRYCGAPAFWVYWRRHEHESGYSEQNDGPHCTIWCWERRSL